MAGKTGSKKSTGMKGKTGAGAKRKATTKGRTK